MHSTIQTKIAANYSEINSIISENNSRFDEKSPKIVNLTSKAIIKSVKKPNV